MQLHNLYTLQLFMTPNYIIKYSFMTFDYESFFFTNECDTNSIVNHFLSNIDSIIASNVFLIVVWRWHKRIPYMVIGCGATSKS